MFRNSVAPTQIRFDQSSVFLAFHERIAKLANCSFWVNRRIGQSVEIPSPCSNNTDLVQMSTGLLYTAHKDAATEIISF